MKNALLTTLLAGTLAAAGGAKQKNKQPAQQSALDHYIEEAMRGPAGANPASSGSLWNPAAPTAGLARDVRARAVNDLVVIHVVERASAVAKGDLKSSRQSSLKATVSSVAGRKSATGALANLANTNTSSSIDGGASTTRETLVSTTLAARVTHVLPNGYLVLEGTKEVQLNSERQIVTVRGMARPADLFNNTVLSDHLAQLEVRVNGKGVVGDAIRRPFILYRLLMGILPL